MSEIITIIGGVLILTGLIGFMDCDESSPPGRVKHLCIKIAVGIGACAIGILLNRIWN